MRIIEQPQDQFVDVGDTAIFNCRYTESFEIPFWIINATFYTTRSLPSRHSYRQQRLKVSNVQVSDNTSTYQCVFLEISSQVATLIVNTEDKGKQTRRILQ